MSPGLRSLGDAHPNRAPCSLWENLFISSWTPHRSQTYSCGTLGFFQRQGPGDYFCNPLGSSQDSDSQRKQPSAKLPDPGNSLVEADTPEPPPRKCQLLLRKCIFTHPTTAPSL